MDRAYAQMAEQVIPFEVISEGTTKNGKRIQDKLGALAKGGYSAPDRILTNRVANGLHTKINELATKHNIPLTIDSVRAGMGGYTEGNTTSVSPNLSLIARGAPANTKMLLDVISRALDQDGGNVIRKPTVAELNDSRVKKNLVATFNTQGLKPEAALEFFKELSALTDANGHKIATGFTQTKHGIAIGDQFHGGDMKAAIEASEKEISEIMAKHKVEGMKLERMIIDTHLRATDGKGKDKSKFASDLTKHLHDLIENSEVEGEFDQVTDQGQILIDRARAGRDQMQKGKNSVNAKIKSRVDSDIDAARLRGSIDEKQHGLLRKQATDILSGAKK